MIKLSNYVGKTPLIPLSIGKYTVWGKAELMNPGGSVKDRMASFILNDAEEKNIIKKKEILFVRQHQEIRNFFSMLAAERGYKMVIIMPSNMSEERKKYLNITVQN